MTNQETSNELATLTELRKLDEAARIELFQQTVTFVSNAKSDIKESNKFRNKYNTHIPVQIIASYLQKDKNFMAVIDQGLGRVDGIPKSQAFVDCKANISKACSVCKHHEKGLFTTEELEGKSFSTLYDMIKKRKEEDKAVNDILQQQLIQENNQLLAVYGTQEKVNEFRLSPDAALMLSEKLTQGQTILAEQEAETERRQAHENMGNTVTDMKACIIHLQNEYPEYFTEVKNHLLSLLETPKTKKAQELKKVG